MHTISHYLAQEAYAEQLKQETLSRWQEAKSGKVISHEAVLLWLDTWGTDKETGRPPCSDSFG